MRINKYLASSGFCSRRRADALIEDGLVTINGKTAQLGDKVNDGDKVTADGHVIDPSTVKDVYIAFNKPYGAICTADPEADNTVFDYIDIDERLLYVGRLDVESSGLLLLTNNGDVANKIAHGSGEHEKEYVVTADRKLTRSFIENMRKGVVIEGQKTKPARAKRISDTRFQLTLTEGRNRQIRKMCEALGYDVKKLRRTRVMNVELGDLGEGNWRPLTKTERRNLLAAL